MILPRNLNPTHALTLALSLVSVRPEISGDGGDGVEQVVDEFE